MNISNAKTMTLDEGQADLLIQLFRPSFDVCLQQASSNSLVTSFIWTPVLTDIHQQVVHTLGPVLVHRHESVVSLSPTLSLLALPVGQPASIMGTLHQAGLAAELLPITKPTL